MRFKYYLRGLGIGIFVTTVILMISFRIHEEKITDTDIVIRAKELGMVFADEVLNGSGDDKDKKPQDTSKPEDSQGEEQNPQGNGNGNDKPSGGENQGGEENPTGDNPGSGDNPGGSDTPGSGENPGGGDTPGNGDNPGGADNPGSGDNSGGSDTPGGSDNPGGAQQPAVTYLITVADGDYCRQIAEKLAANGLIQDTEDFCKYMQTQGLDNDIPNGEYEVPAGADYETIAHILNPR